MTCVAVPLDMAAMKAMNAAVTRDKHDWAEIMGWIKEGAAQVWLINGTGYAMTVANVDDEIEVILAGGFDARGCVGPWEEAMKAHPAHKGKTLRIEGRKGWQRLLPHWNSEVIGDRVILTTRAA